MAFLVPFATYYDFSVVKTHFSSEVYDAKRNNYRYQKLKYQAEKEFESNPPKNYRLYEQIGKKFSSRESFRNHLIANFIYRTDVFNTKSEVWSAHIQQMFPNTQESTDANQKFRKRNESVDYGMREDLKRILIRCQEEGINPNDYFRHDRGFPRYVVDLLRDEVRFESLIVLNRVLKFFNLDIFRKLTKDVGSLHARHAMVLQKMLKYDLLLDDVRPIEQVRRITLDIYNALV